MYLPPRYRGRIVLTRDPDGEERCVACNLCAVACPVGCISLQKAEQKDGRWYPEFFRINFSRCIFCGMCEEACPTTAIQLTPDFEMGEFKRQDLVYEKEDLLISGPGKNPEYNFYRMAGMAIDGKAKGEAENEAKPINVKGCCLKEQQAWNSPFIWQVWYCGGGDTTRDHPYQPCACAAVSDRLVDWPIYAVFFALGALLRRVLWKSSSTPAPSWCCSCSW